MFPKARTPAVGLGHDPSERRARNDHITHFADHKADVLVGTQMLAKGLDLPMVTLVGIVLADVGLHLPDPFAAERVFQVLSSEWRGARVAVNAAEKLSCKHSILQIKSFSRGGA
ncbi:MAG: hypothetical protein U0X93_17895 [Anaerolineales bacterium]